MRSACRSRGPRKRRRCLPWVKANTPEIYARAGCADAVQGFHHLSADRRARQRCVRTCRAAAFCACPIALTMIRCCRSTGWRTPGLCCRGSSIRPQIAGTVSAKAAAETGLAEGTPVIGGYFDVVASALGAGVGAPGDASIIVGTWSINQVFSAEPVVDPSVFMVAGFGPGRFVSIESSATSAANLEWYVREFIERGGHQRRSVRLLQHPRRLGPPIARRSALSSLPLRVGTGRRFPGRLLRHWRLARRRAPAARHFRRRDVRAPPPCRSADAKPA